MQAPVYEELKINDPHKYAAEAEAAPEHSDHQKCPKTIDIISSNILGHKNRRIGSNRLLIQL